MAEYFDGRSLYDILHNTLGIRNDEIGCLGFALHDEYVNEQLEVDGSQPASFPESGKLANMISVYEELHQIPDGERITRLAPGPPVTALTPMCQTNGFTLCTGRLLLPSNWRAMKSRGRELHLPR